MTPPSDRITPSAEGSVVAQLRAYASEALAKRRYFALLPSAVIRGVGGFVQLRPEAHTASFKVA